MGLWSCDGNLVLGNLFTLMTACQASCDHVIAIFNFSLLGFWKSQLGSWQSRLQDFLTHATFPNPTAFIPCWYLHIPTHPQWSMLHLCKPFLICITPLQTSMASLVHPSHSYAPSLICTMPFAHSLASLHTPPFPICTTALISCTLTHPQSSLTCTVILVHPHRASWTLPTFPDPCHSSHVPLHTLPTNESE